MLLGVQDAALMPALEEVCLQASTEDGKWRRGCDVKAMFSQSYSENSHERPNEINML